MQGAMAMGIARKSVSHVGEEMRVPSKSIDKMVMLTEEVYASANATNGYLDFPLSPLFNHSFLHSKDHCADSGVRWLCEGN
jgi:hypothetical protein